MANVFAVKSGDWSDTTVWNTGALPTAADDVWANNFIVTINTSPTVLTIRNGSASGITAGGRFVPANGNTLTCTASVGLIPGSGTLFLSSLPAGSSFTLVSNIANSFTGFVNNVQHTGAGTLIINGNVSGSSASNSLGADNTGSGVLTINGTVTGGTSSFTFGVRNLGSGTLNINGLVTGGVVSGVENTLSGVVNITGSVTSIGAAPGVNNASTGTINITGTCTGGSSTGSAFVNSSTGTITHIGVAQASATAPAIGAGAVGQVTILTGPLLSTDASVNGAAASGVNPCVAARWFPADTALSTFEYRMRGQTVAGSPSARPERRMFLTNAYDATYPTSANVRSATTYGPGSIYTGTLAVPPAGSVALGVPVDNTTGTATFTQNDLANALSTALGTPTAITGISSALTSASAVTLNQPITSLTTPNSIGERLKNSATVATVAQQISDAISSRQ